MINRTTTTETDYCCSRQLPPTCSASVLEPNKCDEGVQAAENDIFHNLRSTELLKHLLNVSDEKKDVETCSEEKQSSVSLMPVPVPVLETIEVEDGYREDLQRYLSDESSIEDELRSLSSEILAHQAMDFILHEAERALHIQSSPSSQDSDCELTELLPMKMAASSLLSPTSGSSCSPNGVVPSDIVAVSDEPSASQFRASADNDNDLANLDEDMVLVPSGKCYRNVLE